MKRIKSSLKLIALFIASSAMLSLGSCEDDEEPAIERVFVEKEVPTYNATFRMSQKANGMDLQMSTAGKPYTNEAGQDFNVTRLRYLISDITFHMDNGSSFTIDGYHFVDASDSSTFTYAPTAEIPAGTYEMVSFKFGFDRFDNISGAYPDLNALSWAWPSGIGGTPNLGGGYHFMQLEGNYDSLGVEKRFLTHMGTARNNNVTPTTYEDNHFVAYPTISPLTVDGDFELNIVMNVEQWYEDPYQWDFNVYNVMIMPNYDAQRKLNLNGPSVFTIE
ncbi:MAG: hypothetical protein CMP59_11670 [Flavobacteriales bacterium]|nr:hypothetical protein [Flavobacteriales bacterium]|tara:strand:+ start:1788 stop:2615 length:828 start_codon:yes stop_codon:yes gene_type:complete